MYANMRVTVGETIYMSHLVEVDGNDVVIHLDANDGGSTAEPAGTVEIDLTEGPSALEIQADF